MPYTLDQLESFVSSAHYDSATAGMIARGVPTLKAADGELISPGVRRIRGNLCNVHGRYGPCDKALSGKKKPGKPAKARQTPAQRAQARTQQHEQNASDVAKQMQDSDTGLAPAGSKALLAFAQGTQPDASAGAGLAKMGLAEQAQDGSYRMTPTGRAVVSAMRAGDYQRAVDAVSRGADASSARQGRATERTARQSAAQAKRAAAAAERSKRRAEREAAQRAKKPAKASSGGSKKPEKPAAKPRQQRRGTASGATSSSSSGGGAAPKPVAAPKPEKAPAKQIAPALQTAADQLSQGAKLSDADTQALIRNGLAKLNKEGEIVLTAAGMRATTKSSFKVFKDANGRHRWVAQSSTAFQDRDKEIVSTKALADDCRWADTHEDAYGPLRWWHTPGLDLGDCDFNAMHGRVLIESGTFRSPAIAQKVAAAASGLEISLGFIHLPSEPDADGVFHHIRRFERSLVPRGKASNRFTAFTVKELPRMDAAKKDYLKTELKFSDAEIADIEARATATEKAADDAQTAFKADEPAPPEEITIGGVVYTVKAFPPKKADDEPAVEAVIETDAFGDAPIEEEVVDDPSALTLSAGDLAAIGEAIQAAVATIMGGLDLEKKVASHVQGFLAPMQATKDAEAAQTKEQIEALQTTLKDTQDKLNELLGLQPAIQLGRQSESASTLLNPLNPADARLLEAIKAQQPVPGPFDDIAQKLGVMPARQ